MIASPQHRPLQVTPLVEQEQRMVAGTFKVPIVRRALLSAVGFTDRAIQVEDQFFQGLALMHRVDPPAREVQQGREVALGAEDLRLEPAYPKFANMG